MDYLCVKFGEFIFSRFGLTVRDTVATAIVTRRMAIANKTCVSGKN